MRMSRCTLVFMTIVTIISLLLGGCGGKPTSTPEPVASEEVEAQAVDLENAAAVVEGEIMAVMGSAPPQLSVMTANEQRYHVMLDGQTEIDNEGEPGSYEDLKMGMRVRVTGEATGEAMYLTATKIEITAPRVLPTSDPEMETVTPPAASGDEE